MRVNQPYFKQKIKFNDRLVTIGSCFSQTIGIYMRQNKFDVHVNPFGTVYNPISIFRLLQYSIGKGELPANGFVQNGEVHHHFDFHSDLSALSKAQLHTSILEQIDATQQFLKTARWLIITFGTSIVYKLKSTGEVVANCHKVPQQQFNREFLSVDTIAEAFNDLYNNLTASNPKLNIIVTVSPVRHVKDGLEGNAYSKSILRVTCQELSNSYDGIHYFPSYEIMMDDLRDYRFYGSDLIHPNQVAEDYIWEIFKKSFVSENDQSILQQWDKLRKALEHRPRHPETEAYKFFLKDTLDRLEKMNEYLNLRDEIDRVKSLL